EAALGFIPLVCEALDLLECYDINYRYVLVVHDGVCEGAVSNGMGYIGFGIFFLSLAFCHLALWTAKSIYIFGMYDQVPFIQTFTFKKPGKRTSVYIIEKRKSILDERDRLAEFSSLQSSNENANSKLSEADTNKAPMLMTDKQDDGVTFLRDQELAIVEVDKEITTQGQEVAVEVDKDLTTQVNALFHEGS
ncbi:hypothetical protein CYMTET_50329, partial [Cymbomonas tetramitiformis]